jgi:hypothetical protein
MILTVNPEVEQIVGVREFGSTQPIAGLEINGRLTILGRLSTV